MSEYILILTLIFKSGYGGMGGVETLEVNSEQDCHRIGMAWAANVKKRRSYAKPYESFYTCVPK